MPGKNDIDFDSPKPHVLPKHFFIRIGHIFSIYAIDSRLNALSPLSRSCSDCVNVIGTYLSPKQTVPDLKRFSDVSRL